jgi:hypothetical protein
VPWWREVTGDQWRAFNAVFLGWIVDSFDFNILAFIIIDIQQSFDVNNALAGLLGTVTLVMRLLGGTVAGTMADKYGRKLPLTLSIDPLAPETRARVEDEARLASWPAGALDQPVTALDAEGRLRLHLARAAATTPALVLLEHPTSQMTDPAASARIGETLRTMADARGFGWIALSEDEAFASASGATVLALDGASGDLAPPKRGWRRWL